MENRAIQTLNPLQDPCSPYFMSPNENPGAILVSKALKGENYHSSSRAMWMSIKTKNKLHFIDGSLPKPSIEDPSFNAWDRCNTLVVSWLTQSIDASIVQSILWMDTALEIWQDLRERYYQGDVFRIVELLREIYTYRQGNLSIAAYHNHIKGLWQELDNFRPIPGCTCTHKCICNLIPTIKGYRENDYVICFLNGLNEQYEGVRSQIMLMDPLPTINKAFCLLTQQERHINSQLGEPMILMNTSNNENFESDIGRDTRSSRGRGRGRAYQTGRGMGRSLDGRGTKTCTFCHKNGHTVDQCFKKYGFPPGNSKTYTINNIATNETQSYDSASQDQAKDQALNNKINRGAPGVNITPQQHQTLLSILQPGITHITNQFATHSADQNENDKGTVNILNCNAKSLDWFLDTGATYHICHTLSQFQTYKKINTIFVTLPNGSQIPTNISGSVMFSSHLYLVDVLYIPCFSYNLISISKLIETSPCQLTFVNNVCHIQDLPSLRMIGVAELRSGLYAMKDHVRTLPIIHKTDPGISINAFNTYDTNVWHSRLGHPSHGKMLEM
ncbi:PREDICTED: uncharacterized protein LOC109353838 [Lupinus angustifolius]|uniref:uncharacterized protein LOC109353838 n=1 Tax=Lupinus angustifolius TaxID=3871 RepID=UPI00092E97EA|nr:PREDICTED: uncharacterized protein LOC109353838 [Lupinus angustifolius]